MQVQAQVAFGAALLVEVWAKLLNDHQMAVEKYIQRMSSYHPRLQHP